VHRDLTSHRYFGGQPIIIPLKKVIRGVREVILAVENLIVDPSGWTPSNEEREFLVWATSESEQEIRRRIFEVQARAYEVWPYPCIRLLVFLELRMRNASVYDTILEQVRSVPPSEAPKLVEVGCFMGTQLRKLLMDGYPSHEADPSLIGIDLRKEFIDYGYDLFQDRPSSKRPVPIAFHQADIFDDDSKLTSFKGRVRYIFIHAVFHLFDKDTQYELARRLVDLLDVPPTTDPDLPDREYIIFGTQVGSKTGMVIENRCTIGNPGNVACYSHSPDTWRAMFEKIIASKYGVNWMRSHAKLEAQLAEPVLLKDFLYTELAWSVHLFA